MNLWDEVYISVGKVIVRAKFTPFVTDSLLSITTSASHLAEEVYKVHQDYYRPLGKMTSKRAIPFITVFALAMTSRWVRQACNRDPSLGQRTLWATLATAILRLFDDTSQDHYQEAWLLDLQFNHDCTLAEQGKKFASWNEQWLLLCLAARSLGAPFTWKLSSPPIPFSSARDLYGHGSGWDPPPALKLLDVQKFLEVHDALLAAEAGMDSAFKALTENRQQKSVRS